MIQTILYLHNEATKMKELCHGISMLAQDEHYGQHGKVFIRDLQNKVMKLEVHLGVLKDWLKEYG